MGTPGYDRVGWQETAPSAQILSELLAQLLQHWAVVGWQQTTV